MGKFLVAVIAIFICFNAQRVSADESPQEQMRRQMEDLQSQLEQLQSMAGGMMPTLPPTPQDKLNLVIDSINRNYVNLRNNLYAGNVPETEQLIPVPMATRLSGYVQVHGIDVQQYKSGFKPRDLKYNVREDFIGYLITMRYFDTHLKKFTKKKDYEIGTISTNIQVNSVSGRQCVNIGNDGCHEWASFAQSEINRDNIYPAIHDWVVLADSDKGVVSFNIESPNVLFSSPNKRAIQGLGCYGADIDMDLEDLSDRIKEQSYSDTVQVGKMGGGSDCSPGSSIDVHIDFCDKTKYANLNDCRQVEMLFGTLKQSLALRDGYKKWGSSAENIDQLNMLVTREISTDYPLIDLLDDDYLDGISASINCSQIHIPDLCKGCMPKPLCQWEREALLAHEQNHQQLLAARSDYHTLQCGTTLQIDLLYPDANERHKAEARALADLEYNAYNEQAHHINDIIQQQMHNIFGCSLSPDFLIEYQAIQQRLDQP